MAYSKSQNKATQKYIKEKYEQVIVRFPKGTREKYKAHAAQRGTSLNKLIVDLLEDDIKHNVVNAN